MAPGQRKLQKVTASMPDGTSATSAQEFGFWEVVPAQQSRANSLDGRRTSSMLSADSSGDASADAPLPAEDIHLGAGDRSRSESRASLASSDGTAGAAGPDRDAGGEVGTVHREGSSGELVPQQQQQKRGWWFRRAGKGYEKLRERRSWAARPLLPAPFSTTRAKDDNLRLAITICARCLSLE